MKRIVWSEDFKLGIQMIDTQHEQLVNIINRILECLENNSQHADLAALLTEYQKSTEAHFADEENFMQEIGYPERAVHSELHRGFSGRMNTFRGQLMEQEASLNSELSDYLEFWLIDHIVINDSLYASHVGTRDEVHLMV